ncbi:MAG: hypothetical protein MCS20_01395 [Candidatus Phytoplasma mali]|nr:hypothetical protein [Candidatus Phytoplasma australiense]MCG7202052.1 hypothetical protein [Candidatus Phytoplasma mali]
MHILFGPFCLVPNKLHNIPHFIYIYIYIYIYRVDFFFMYKDLIYL